MDHTPHHKEQIGDYVLELMNPRDFWHVRMVGETPGEATLGIFNTAREGRRAIRRYSAENRRRAKAR